MRGLLICVAAATLLAGSARAQQADSFAGALAGGANVFGEAIGAAANDRPGILVTGIGHAKLETPADVFDVNVDGKAATAVEAAAIRDARLKQLREVAQQFGVTMEIGESAFSMEVDAQAQARQMAEFQARRAAAVSHPGTPLPAFPVDASRSPQLFAARTGVRFTQPSSEKMAAFLDALKTAGVEDLSGMLNVNPATSMLQQTFQVLGFGTVGKIDDAIWQKAGEDAIADARRQAQSLAAAAGRTLGPAEQVTYMARSSLGKTVTVAVAVRYAFAEEKP